MSERIPSDNGNVSRDDDSGLAPELQNEALKVAIEDWSKAIIDDDGLFRVISDKLVNNDSESDIALPDFSIQPTMKPQEDGSRLWGLRISESRTKSQDGLSIGFDRYKHIPVAKFIPEENRWNLDPTFVSAVAGEKPDARREAIPSANKFIQLTVEMLGKATDSGVDVVFDRYGDLTTAYEQSHIAYADDEFEV